MAGDQDALLPHNALGIWWFAREHFLSILEKTSWKFVLERFVEISKEGEFSELPAEMLGMVLASDQLSCGGGECVGRSHDLGRAQPERGVGGHQDDGDSQVRVAGASLTLRKSQSHALVRKFRSC